MAPAYATCHVDSPVRSRYGRALDFLAEIGFVATAALLLHSLQPSFRAGVLSFVSPKAATELLTSGEVASPDSSPRPLVESLSGGAGRARSAIARLSDARLALLLAVCMFVLSAWPLALVEVPPYQDLPNHLAAVEVMNHPQLYPELVFNGWFKTNTALFAWLFFAGKLFGLKLAAKLFSLIVLAATAFALPRFVLELTGDRRRMTVTTLFIWPFVHNWFVCMGMLDFAFAIPLAMLMIVAMHRHERAPSWKTAAAVTLFGVLTWSAHVFCLLVVLMLAAIHALVQRGNAARFTTAKKLAVPLFVPSALAIVSVIVHAMDPIGPMTGNMRLQTLLPPWELVYNMWAEWFWSFTKLTLCTLVPMFALTYYGFKSLFTRRESPPFFSGIAIAVLVVLYVFGPYTATNWFHVNSRFVPFFWLGLALRVPTTIPKKLAALLGVSALVGFIGLGVDYVRLDRDREAFTAGMSQVPERARLLPLIFRGKMTSDNTASLLHAWGYYVVEKHTSAPLLFAHSRSFPVMYKEPPPTRFNHLVLENFAPTMKSPDWLCGSWQSGGVVVDDCQRTFTDRWAEFWADATPRFDHVLMWDASPQAIALVPKDYELVFHQDRLMIYKRKDAQASK
jgi:hypothetical protein